MKSVGFRLKAGIAIEITKCERIRALIIDKTRIVNWPFRIVLKKTAKPKK